METSQSNQSLSAVLDVQQAQRAASERITDLTSDDCEEAQRVEAMNAYATTVDQLVTLLGHAAHCCSVDIDLWTRYSDLFKSIEGSRPRHHVTRDEVQEWLSTPQSASYSGFMTHAGERLQVDFMAPREASQEALDSAFLNTLAQQVEIEYLRIG
ncbi:hypothetical protein C8C94_5057 [Acidovorax sp. 94]|uniref:hypothetical protein n=1 Tax=Acidovorax sp. 94 TaxID=2135633 RepID=UPI00095EA4F7|nr:hypothetical protein [Acidovorax sp. 94]OJV67255.1 MAG: hypothetical protein BGO35_01975 [Burkholderiales bacterium 64-34]RKR52867.1 hypothetical protein C8C94_5057 [Acidovorax sp. 94]